MHLFLMPTSKCSKAPPTPTNISTACLCGGLNLGQSLALFESSLLLESHNLEAVEVGQVLPSLDLLTLLGPVALLPLGVDLVLLPKLLDGTVSGATDEALNNELGEQALGQGNGLSGDSQSRVGGRTVDENLCKKSRLILHSSLPGFAGYDKTYSLVVNDLDDGSKSASEGVVSVDGNNATNLNEAPVGSLNHCFAHCDRCSNGSLSVAMSI
jgi:hypothetical protein